MSHTSGIPGVELIPDKWKNQLVKSSDVLFGETAPAADSESRVAEVPKEPPQLAITSLPDVTLTEEDANAILEETSRRKHLIRVAGSRLHNYQQSKKKIDVLLEAADGDTGLSPLLQEKAKAVDEGMKTIASLDDELKKRVEFAAFIESIKQCDPSDRTAVQQLIDRAITMKRYRLATAAEMAEKKSMLPGTLYFFGRVYLPEPFPKPAPGQEALEHQLGALVLKARGNHPVADLLAGKEGYYYLHSQKGREDKLDGHVLARVFEDEREDAIGLIRKKVMIRIAWAVGSTRHLSDHTLGQTSIPLEWVLNGRIVTRRRLEQSSFDRYLILMKSLRRMLKLWNPQQEKPKARAASAGTT